MTSEAILVDVMDNVSDKTVKTKGRNNFYSLPKTLSEDDDPFGIFQGSKDPSKTQQSVSDDLMMMNPAEPSTGLLVQIETDSPKISISESFNSVSSRNSMSGTGAGLLGVSGYSVGASSISGLSINGVSSNFGNISKVSSAANQNSYYNTVLSDDVFIEESPSQLVNNDDEPNWDKLLNEAQFVALKISDPQIPTKTPLTHSKFSSTAKLTSYSPGDNIDSPTSGLLMDTSKDNPENFLVQLTPETSPKKCSSLDLGITASPALEKKISMSNLVESSKKPVDDVEKKPLASNETPNKSNSSKKVSTKKTSSVPPPRKFSTPERKDSKENIGPRPLPNTDIKKVSSRGVSMNQSLKPKLPATEMKKQALKSRQPSMSSRRSLAPASGSNKSSVSSTSSVTEASSRPNSAEAPELKPSASAVKTLQFTPKNTGFRVGRRESSSAVKNPSTSKPVEAGPEFKLPSKTTDAHMKKTIAPPRSGRLQPTKLSMNPSSGAGSSMIRPTRGPTPVKAMSDLTAASLARSSGLQRPTLLRQGSGLQRPTLLRQGSSLQRPSLLRQGSALCQSMATPTTSRVRRPSDVGLKSSSGMCLPSPQVVNKNSSLVCSTPTVVGAKQSRDSVLPSPITSVKRKV